MSKPTADSIACGHADCPDLATWVCSIGDRADSSMSLLVPEFQLHDGGVFFASLDTQSYRAWLHAFKGNKTAAQAVMNHRHILELFLRAEQEPSRLQVVCLGRKLEKLWAARLKCDFPTENIVVAFREAKEQSGDELLAHLITFFIPREEDKTNQQSLFLGACHPRAHL